MSTFLSVIETAEKRPPADGPLIAFDLGRELASYRPDEIAGRSVVWALTESPMDDAELSVEIDISETESWVMRCDRIDFPPGGIAYEHTHPGPGIRRLLFGELKVTVGGEVNVYAPGDPWYESGPQPVLAEATDSEPTAFVRVLVLPIDWKGKRTIRYVNPEDDDRPKLQTATVYLEAEIEEMPGA